MKLLLMIAALAASGGAALAQNSTAPLPAPAASPIGPPPVAAQGGGGGAILKACGADFQKLCPGMIPGDGKLRACVQANLAQLSTPCKSALAARRAAAPPAQQ